MSSSAIETVPIESGTESTAERPSRMRTFCGSCAEAVPIQPLTTMTAIRPRLTATFLVDPNSDMGASLGLLYDPMAWDQSHRRGGRRGEAPSRGPGLFFCLTSC